MSNLNGATVVITGSSGIGHAAVAKAPTRRTVVGRIGQLLLITVLLMTACAPRITTEQEMALGQDLAQQIEEELDLIDDPAVVGYVNELGQQIVAVADPRNAIDYSFNVVNTQEINAFAVPGGHIYLHRGLVEASENLAEFAGVVAHEIAHVVERHGIDQWRRAQQAEMGLQILYGVLLGRQPGPIEGAAVQLGAAGVFAGYSREAEREADDEAIGYLIDAGIHPIGLVDFFQTLMDTRDREPGRVEQFFATHPATQERIDNTRAAIEALPEERLEGLQRDSEAFQTFRRQVSALPPPPS